MIHGEVHGMLAGHVLRATAARLVPKDLNAAGSARCLTHSNRLLCQRKLLFDVLDDSAPDCLLDLFSMSAPLLLIILEAHLSDLIRDALLLEVGQGPIPRNKLFDLVTIILVKD